LGAQREVAQLDPGRAVALQSEPGKT